MESTLIMAADSIYRSRRVCTQLLISCDPAEMVSWLILTQIMNTAMAMRTETFLCSSTEPYSMFVSFGTSLPTIVVISVTAKTTRKSAGRMQPRIYLNSSGMSSAFWGNGR